MFQKMAEASAFWCRFRKVIRPTNGSRRQRRDHRWAVERRYDMYWSESKRRRCVDMDWEANVALRKVSLEAVRKRMS